MSVWPKTKQGSRLFLDKPLFFMLPAGSLIYISLGTWCPFKAAPNNMTEHCEAETDLHLRLKKVFHMAQFVSGKESLPTKGWHPLLWLAQKRA